MKKRISFALVLVMLILNACSVDEQPTQTTGGNDTTSAVPETTRVYPDVSGIDYGGEEFRVLYFDPDG